MKSTALFLCGLFALAGAMPLAAAKVREPTAKVCTTLGKVHAQRDRQLYTVVFQSLNGRLMARRGDACIQVSVGEHVLGLTANVEGAIFPRRRVALGALKEQKLPLTIEPNRTYTIAAQLVDRYQGSWIPVVQRVELWATPQ